MSCPVDGPQAPWLADGIAELRRARLAGRLPAALLIHGQEGAGGAALADYATAVALCRSHAPPCGTCRDCELLAAGTHPDAYAVTLTGEARQIRVEQIRELCEALALTAHSGAASVARIDPADAMNANAANALLKTLEEPRAGVTLVLVAAAPARLPATIVSRCQRLRVPTPTREQSRTWLTERRGAGPWDEVLDVIGEAPFSALASEPRLIVEVARETGRALATLPSHPAEIERLAAAWAREHYELRLACLETWLTSRIDEAVRRGRQSGELRSGAQLREGGSDLNMASLLRVLDGLHELVRLRARPINRALALEQLLWEIEGA